MSDGFFLVGPLDAAVAGDVVEVAGPEARHLAVVRRIGPGEVVTLADGAGHGVRGPVLVAERDRASVEVRETLAAPEPRPRVTVVQALPKAGRGELAVDLMTEVGVDQIVPWSASRSIVKWSGERGEKALAKWRATAREAAKQSRRLTVPEVTELATTTQVLDLVAGRTTVVMHETAPTPVSTLAADPAVPLVVVIGPEGGIAPDELARFEALGAKTYSMGDTVLRTSTAGAVAVTQLRLLASLSLSSGAEGQGPIRTKGRTS
ncbi:MAG: 16S rRNA (uracil(1498)-N(3))-methyltransferase [Propionibacteriaceae bacterium]|nr:16S rRNA (uracil(1498)-N(3))-methyltransferase [Propionibacteriaceae bacterium]